MIMTLHDFNTHAVGEIKIKKKNKNNYKYSPNPENVFTKVKQKEPNFIMG